MVQSGTFTSEGPSSNPISRPSLPRVFSQTQLKLSYRDIALQLCPSSEQFLQLSTAFQLSKTSQGPNVLLIAFIELEKDANTTRVLE